MNDEIENPPAFPHVIPDEWKHAEEGMSLRDYFAAAALTRIVEHPEGPTGDWPKAAQQAYYAADAMLLARRK